MWFNSPRDTSKLPRELFQADSSWSGSNKASGPAVGGREGGDGHDKETSDDFDDSDDGIVRADSSQTGGSVAKAAGMCLDTAAVLVCVTFVLSLAGGASSS